MWEAETKAKEYLRTSAPFNFQKNETSTNESSDVYDFIYCHVKNVDKSKAFRIWHVGDNTNIGETIWHAGDNTSMGETLTCVIQIDRVTDYAINCYLMNILYTPKPNMVGACLPFTFTPGAGYIPWTILIRT